MGEKVTTVGLGPSARTWPAAAQRSSSESVEMWWSISARVRSVSRWWVIDVEVEVVEAAAILGFSCEVKGCRVWDLGFRIRGLGFRVYGLGLRV